jgi:hypothetical protein
MSINQYNIIVPIAPNIALALLYCYLILGAHLWGQVKKPMTSEEGKKLANEIASLKRFNEIQLLEIKDLITKI